MCEGISASSARFLVNIEPKLGWPPPKYDNRRNNFIVGPTISQFLPQLSQNSDEASAVESRNGPLERIRTPFFLPPAVPAVGMSILAPNLGGIVKEKPFLEKLFS